MQKRRADPTLPLIIQNGVCAISHDLSEAFQSGERNEIIRTLERNEHLLGKLLVISRWLGRNPVLHDITTFNAICHQSILQLHSNIKEFNRNANETVMQRRGFPHIVTALQVLLNGTFPLPEIPYQVPDYYVVKAKINRYLRKYLYTNYQAIQCDKVDIVEGVMMITKTNSFTCWVTVGNPDSLFCKKIPPFWSIVELQFFTPQKAVASDELVNEVNVKLGSAEFMENTIPKMINVLDAKAKNAHFEALVELTKSKLIIENFPKMVTSVVTNTTEKVLKINYWSNAMYLEYHLRTKTSEFFVSHNGIVKLKIDTTKTLFEQLVFVARESAKQTRRVFWEALQKDFSDEVILADIQIAPFTGKITLVSHFLPKEITAYYADMMTKIPLDQLHPVYNDLYAHTRLSQIYQGASLFFIEKELVRVGPEMVEPIETHTKKFDQIRGEVLIPRVFQNSEVLQNVVCGMLFKIQMSEDRSLIFFVTKKTNEVTKKKEETMVCVGFKGADGVNYSSCSKEVFSQTLPFYVEKVYRFCSESYSKYSTKMYMESFKDKFPKTLASLNSSVTSSKTKSGFILFNSNLPFMATIEQPPDDEYYILSVGLKSVNLDKFKPSNRVQIQDKYIRFMIPKRNVDTDVIEGTEAFIKFIHVVAFAVKCVERLVSFSENTIVFKGFSIEFVSQTFDTIQIVTTLNEEYIHLSEILKFEFFDSPKGEGNKKSIALSNCNSLLNSLSMFTLYFDSILEVLKGMNMSCVSVNVMEFSSVTLFISTEDEKANDQTFVIFFSFIPKMEDKTMNLHHKTLDNFGKKKFPLEVFKETMKQIPNNFKVNEIEKYMKMLLGLIHIMLVIEFVCNQTTRSIENRNYRISIRQDLSLKLPTCIPLDTLVTATLIQTPQPDPFTKFFNAKFSNPLKSGMLIDAKNLMNFIAKKTTVMKNFTDIEPLATLCGNSLSVEKMKNIYDFTLEEQNNIFIIHIFVYSNEQNYIRKNPQHKMLINYMQGKFTFGCDQADTLMAQVVSAGMRNSVSTFRQMVMLLQESFESEEVV
ncbi:hypothetical protein EIN_409550 [Entamoeba invadens IP1]|uniref:Mediator of RNA polymerase II transcription subunit 14 n=1 Tax=Entamoeba invadens IP1 TaxID=370355 RepID=A0A0A1TWS7_ENTIV|nr:hypothetical protein EIN_409550 [Entamoeba invadens IP1]ELP85646.1 hypothetical protein EIN_409550 [Entamoeba invadens IP1]|eukprot:XP_004184992.1 hypothetical protein EIN_409550 [Entamoeba invadens IP1]